MNLFLTLAFLFFIGSIFGWGLEVFYRRFFSSANPERRWINPGFLVGPYLPLYGFSLCTLYLLACCKQFLPIANPVVSDIVLFCIMAVCVTAIEYLAGMIFIKGMKIKLWDYSHQWGNISGVICPKFTFFWWLLSAAYYFFVNPYILGALDWLSKNLAFSFCIGFFFGVFTLDFVHSARLLVKIRAFAEKNGITVKLVELQSAIRESKEKRMEKAKFLLTMTSHTPLAEHLKDYLAGLSDLAGRGTPHKS